MAVESFIAVVLVVLFICIREYVKKIAKNK